MPHHEPMRAQMAKAVRRDLWRAMGVGALETIAQQDQSHALLASRLEGLANRLLKLEQRFYSIYMDEEISAQTLNRDRMALEQRCTALEVCRQMDRDEHRLSDSIHTGELRGVSAVFHDFYRRTFWDRLVWLFTGQ